MCAFFRDNFLVVLVLVLVLELWSWLQDCSTLVHAFVTSRVDYCNAVMAGSGRRRSHRQISYSVWWTLLPASLTAHSMATAPLKLRPNGAIQTYYYYHLFGRADVSMSSWNSSTVPGEQLHTNSRRRQSSTSAVRQSAEVDRSAVSTGQLWSSSGFCRFLEFAARQSSCVTQLWVSTFSGVSWKLTFLAKYNIETYFAR